MIEEHRHLPEKLPLAEKSDFPPVGPAGFRPLPRHLSARTSGPRPAAGTLLPGLLHRRKSMISRRTTRWSPGDRAPPTHRRRSSSVALRPDRPRGGGAERRLLVATEPGCELGPRGKFGDPADFREGILRQWHPGERCARLERRTHGIEDVPHLNHLGDAPSMKPWAGDCQGSPLSRSSR